MTAWDFPILTAEPPVHDGAPRAAVLAPLYQDGDEIRLVLTKRPMHMPTHPGDVALPGGKPKAGETPVDTALREAHEEVGIVPATVEVLGYLPEIHTVSYTRMVVPVVGRLPGIPELVLDPNEVVKVLLPTVAELSDPARWKSEDWNGRVLHFFEIDGEILWGATARMVRQLVGLER
jgi:8-oxo-dGTP pyrophosphatase MutT (NUDIX family)